MFKKWFYQTDYIENIIKSVFYAKSGTTIDPSIDYLFINLSKANN